jgi:energy-coupling factor transporter ATP-binding protein EcfA2
MEDFSFPIKKVVGEGIKGVLARWAIDWPRALGRNNQVTIVLGDNGSGKSTIISIIEFCLQARNGSWLNKAAKGVDALLHASGSGSCYAEVTTCDGKKYRRNATTIDGQAAPSPLFPYLGFEVSPFDLRRYDIVRFIEQGSESRQIVLWEYLSKVPIAHKEKKQQEKLQELETERKTLEAKLVDLYSKLASRCRVNASQLPVNSNELREYLKDFTEFPTHNSQSQVNWAITKAYNEISECQRKLKNAKRNYSALLGKAGLLASTSSDVQEVLANAADWITKAFLENSTIEIVRSIEIRLADKRALEITLLLNDEMCTRVDPYLVLSEANIDLLAFLFYLALIRESGARGQIKLMCLDDIFQSVDKVIRLRVLDLIATEFAEWELIITTHDRSWAEAIKAVFLSRKIPVCQIDLGNFKASKGPSAMYSKGALSDKLRNAVADNDSIAIRALAGIAFEECCNKLSMSIGAAIKRKPFDKYTIGDLWPAILARLRNTSLVRASQKLDASLHLRNYAIAHYNESAIDVSEAEIVDFGRDIVNFIDCVFCTKCDTYITRKGPSWACKCGNRKL